jgi:peptide deformylase
MAVRQILQIGDPRLKARNKRVINYRHPAIQKIISDMVDTMRANEMVGIAAPQIGKNWDIIVTEPRETKYRPQDQADELRVYINPQIINFSKTTNLIYEGCGCVVNGNLFGPVIRPQEIIIKAANLTEKKFTLRCDGLLARVIQHEYDHLSGIEFTEKISDYKKLLNRDFYFKFIKNSSPQIQASKITVKEYRS